MVHLHQSVFSKYCLAFAEDAPPDVPMVVTPSKADGGQTFCLKCVYIKRGSFKQLKQRQFLKLKRKNPQLAAKFPDFNYCKRSSALVTCVSGVGCVGVSHS